MPILKTLLSYISSHPQFLRQPSTSLQLAQNAPVFLSSSEATTDSQETWLVYEQLLLACLRTEDDASARLCLQRLGDRFGIDSPRVNALSGIYEEAIAKGRPELEDVLRRYEKTLKEDPANMPIEKRCIALLLSLGRTEDAIKALTNLLSHSPTDAESWSHLASLYRSQGLYSQSIFCLEEVILIHPNAYSIHARIGETICISAGGNNPEALVESMRYYCRSVELCEWYLRGWYGLKLVTDRILASTKGSADIRTVEQLNELATSKLLEIVRRKKAGEKGWQGFDEAEVEAAQELANPGEVVR